MVNGTLTLRSEWPMMWGCKLKFPKSQIDAGIGVVHSLEGLPQIELGENHHIAGMYYVVRVKISAQTQQTKSHGKGQESRIEQDLTLYDWTVKDDLEGADGRESVILDVLDEHKSVLCSSEIAILDDFIEGRKRENYALHGGGNTAHVVLTSKWQQHTKP